MQDDLASELYNRPGHLIRRCYQIVIALYLEESTGSGLTHLQYVILRAARHHPRQSQRRLGELAGIDRTTVGWVVGSLEGKGLVQRIKTDSDRRFQHLELTPLGQRKLRIVDSRMQHLQRRILEPLTASEKKTFMNCLRKIVSANNERSRAPLKPLAATRSRSGRR